MEDDRGLGFAAHGGRVRTLAKLLFMMAAFYTLAQLPKIEDTATFRTICGVVAMIGFLQFVSANPDKREP